MNILHFPKHVRIVALYIVIAGLWVLITDHVILKLTENPDWIMRLEHYKGLVFIAITAILLYIERKHADEMQKIRLMLNLDCLVMSRPKGLVFHKVPGAREYVDALRRQFQEPLPFVERIHAHSDHFPFILKGVPTAESAAASSTRGSTASAIWRGTRRIKFP